MQVKELRKQLEVRVAGFDVPRPLQEFSQCGFDAQLMGAIKKAGCVHNLLLVSYLSMTVVSRLIMTDLLIPA